MEDFLRLFFRPWTLVPYSLGMTGKSEQGGAGDLTAWSLRELEAMLAEQVRLLKADAPVKPEDRPRHIRMIRDLTSTARQLATAKAAMARAGWTLERVASQRAAMTLKRGGGSEAVQQGDDHRADDHDLERRQAAIDAGFAAMARDADARRAARHGAGRDARADRVLAVAGA